MRSPQPTTTKYWMTVVVSWPLRKVFVPLPRDQALTNEPLFKGTRGITVRSPAAVGCSATRSPQRGWPLLVRTLFLHSGAPMGERSQSKWTRESYQEAHGGRCGPPAHINNRLPTIFYSVLTTALRCPPAGLFYNEARKVFVSCLSMMPKQQGIRHFILSHHHSSSTYIPDLPNVLLSRVVSSHFTTPWILQPSQ